jgi:hypothetical protein
MHIVTDAVLAGKHLNGLGIYSIGNISKYHWQLLKRITPNQRRKYFTRGIIPLQLLLLWRDQRYLPGQHDPERPIHIMNLLKYLKNGPYRDRQHYLKGQWLYETILKTELIPRSHAKRKRV